MFCNQCEQTARQEACTVSGVCGKTPQVSALQDLLIHVLTDLSERQRCSSVKTREIGRFAADALFTTVTNVNFDPESLRGYVLQAREMAASLPESGSDPLKDLSSDSDVDSLVALGESLGHPVDQDLPEDLASLKMIVLYGYKGVSAYVHHAARLGQESDQLYAMLLNGLASLRDNSLSQEDWVVLVTDCGKANLLAMELLDQAHTDRYGHPTPTQVPLGTRPNKCVLVSGHDLEDLEELLKQTEGKGIDVYTHGEMLPAHGYPELNKYDHLYGHFGSAWQNQGREFPNFPGAIVMTTNCIQKPRDSYQDSLFTAGLVGWPGIHHLEGRDFSPVIEKALDMPGFQEEVDRGQITVGFGHNAISQVAGQVVKAVQAGKIKHFFLVGGCDGAKPGRNYYSDFASKAPEDTVILTLACGKFRFFDRDLGEIDGIPRLLDVGQCNDAYSAIKVAQLLSDAFEADINDLPLSLVLSWYEQKAVSILLTLLYLGVKDIRLGPSLPAFVSPGVLDFLVQNFDIKPIAATAEQDLAAILSGRQLDT